jgi:hypothetical protein
VAAACATSRRVARPTRTTRPKRAGVTFALLAGPGSGIAPPWRRRCSGSRCSLPGGRAGRAAAAARAAGGAWGAGRSTGAAQGRLRRAGPPRNRSRLVLHPSGPARSVATGPEEPLLGGPGADLGPGVDAQLGHHVLHSGGAGISQRELVLGGPTRRSAPPRSWCARPQCPRWAGRGSDAVDRHG